MTDPAGRDPIAPTLDIPLSVAVEELTGFEILAIEKRFGSKLEQLGATALLIGTVWAFSQRGDDKRSWQACEAMTMRELGGYFAPEPVEPDDETGKE